MREIKISEYLARVKLSARKLNKLSSIDRLAALYNAHLLTFAYSNSKIRQVGFKHPVLRDLDFDDYRSIFFKSTGGYCYQLAALLAEILVKFGYNFEFCEARILMGEEVNSLAVLRVPPTHLIIKVKIDDKYYLLDPGLGSNSPRFPILIAPTQEPIKQDDDKFKFYFLEASKLYVLERLSDKGWLRLFQTDLSPISLDKIKLNLHLLEQHPFPVGIRDEKFVLGKLLPKGRHSLFWLASSNKLKYIENGSDISEDKEVTDYDTASSLAKEKFSVDLSPKEIEKCCSPEKRSFPFFNHNLKLKRAWTVDHIPITKRMREEMTSNFEFKA